MLTGIGVSVLLLALLLNEGAAAWQRHVRRHQPLRRALSDYECDTRLDDYWKDSASQRGRYEDLSGK